MNASEVTVLYAVLAGLSLHAAWLMFTRPAEPLNTRWRGLSYCALAVAFAALALGRAQVLGFQHGQNPTWTRLGFGVYGLSLLIMVVRYWLSAWRLRASAWRKRHAAPSSGSASRM